MSYIIERIEDEMINQSVEKLDELNNYCKRQGIAVEEKKKSGVRTMAEGREGYARLISKIASANDDCLSKMDNASELVSALQYHSSLEDIRQRLLKLMELIDETQWGNSADAMVLVDNYAVALQRARKGKASLDAAMKEVDEWNKRFSHDAPEETPPEETLPQ